jgi:hypothetical protein
MLFYYKAKRLISYLFLLKVKRLVIDCSLKKEVKTSGYYLFERSF